MTIRNQSSIFVGIVVGFLNVCKIRLVASSLPPRYPLKAKWYKKSFIKTVLALGYSYERKQSIQFSRRR